MQKSFQKHLYMLNISAKNLLLFLGQLLIFVALFTLTLANPAAFAAPKASQKPTTSPSANPLVPSVKRIGLLPVESNFKEYRQLIGEAFWNESSFVSAFSSQSEFEDSMSGLWHDIMEKTGRFWMLQMEHVESQELNQGEGNSNSRRFEHSVEQTIKSYQLDALAQFKIVLEPDQAKLQLTMFKPEDFTKAQKHYIVYQEVILPFPTEPILLESQMEATIAQILPLLGHDGKIVSSSGNYVTLDVGEKGGFKIGDYLFAGYAVVKQRHPLTSEVLLFQRFPTELLQITSVNSDSSAARVVSTHQIREKFLEPLLTSDQTSRKLVWRAPKNWSLSEPQTWHEDIFESGTSRKGFFRTKRLNKPRRSQLGASAELLESDSQKSKNNAAGSKQNQNSSGSLNLETDDFQDAEQVMGVESNQDSKTNLTDPNKSEDAQQPQRSTDSEIPGLHPKRILFGLGLASANLKTIKGTQASQFQFPFINSVYLESIHHHSQTLRLEPSLHIQFFGNGLTGQAAQIRIPVLFGVYEDLQGSIWIGGGLGMDSAGLKSNSLNRKSNWDIFGVFTEISYFNVTLIPGFRFKAKGLYQLAGPDGMDFELSLLDTHGPTKQFEVGVVHHKGPSEYTFNGVYLKYHLELYE